MLKHQRTFSLLSALVISVLSLEAQTFFTIADGGVSTCTGALLDSGGEGASGYSNNENYTLTICSDGTGPAISLQWITFNLSTDGASPLDKMTIYDGNSTSAPEIGTWSGTNSPGIISASFENTSGCLTLVFTSNETGTGVFAAAISCFEPCEPPVANATFGSAVPLLACQNETVQFNATASTAAEGFSIEEFRWDFADGELDSLSGSIVSHVFVEPGEYVVQLTVTDDNGCQNTNLIDLQILVSTTPSFAGTTPSTTICEGESVDLLAVPTPVEWSELPEPNLGGGVFLPDELGIPFPTSVTFTQFEPGQTLTDISDLESICVDMEHSFIGDLVISMTCPSGQSVTFHQQNGGGTFLGVPVDDDSQPDAQGVCWNYCWSPTATNGTWEDNAQGTLPSGTYESLNPMSALVGCDLNGTWTFTVTDLWGSDNGFICNWNINFNPALFPELTEFTPILGVSTPDSSHWVGDGYVPDPNNPLAGVATPMGVGVHDYTFSVTDNFGCTYDTTITITVNPGVPGPIVITGDELVCEGVPAYLNAPDGYDTYTWSTGAVGQSTSTLEGGEITVTVGLGDCTLESGPFIVGLLPSPDPVITGPSVGCGAGTSTLSTTETYASYTWSTGSTDPTVAVGTGTYTVTVVANGTNCVGSSSPFSVTVGSDPEADFTIAPPSPQGLGTTAIFSDASTGNGSPITEWAWQFGNLSQSSSPSPSYLFTTPGTHTITLTVTAADGCQDVTSQQYIIIAEPIDIPNVFTPNGDTNNEYFVIQNGQYYENSLSIFNRWGQEIYASNNYRNTWRAIDVPDGTYYYVFKTRMDGMEYTGHVTILR
ncbi:MAG: PKD domain-containing protein [Flavobacteriales bacterium]|nr:PKD domain-containing protein [Flavobacteriales bacterium]